jgi:glycosyltransferase involved in cell wall biosynthesis
MNKKCIIIPAFNEETNIVSVIEGIKKCSNADIVVIDDGSHDRTGENAKNAGALVITHPFNMGYGSALQTGYKYAVKKNYDFVVQMDGDRQHDPKFIPDLFREVEDNRCDVAIGSRFLGKTHHGVGILKFLAIRVLRTCIRMTSGKKITDPTSGYQGLNKKVMTAFTGDFFPADYPDANVIVLLFRMGFAVKEIPVDMIPNPAGRSMHRGLLTVMYYFFKMFVSFVIALIMRRGS